MKFFSVNTISKRTQDILVKNTIRKPSSVLKFMDENSGKLFITTDTERIFFKRAVSQKVLSRLFFKNTKSLFEHIII
jgi:hypothetical protein